MSYRMPRRHYADIYGPTTGDRVRLADTDLVAEVERDHTVYGDECKFGGGKVLRDGMGQAAGVSDERALDLVITNALVIDWTGIYKADVGVKHGRIAGIGKAGNPDVMAGVSSSLIVGATTEAIAGEGFILTAGGVDSHIRRRHGSCDGNQGHDLHAWLVVSRTNAASHRFAADELRVPRQGKQLSPGRPSRAD